MNPVAILHLVVIILVITIPWFTSTPHYLLVYLLGAIGIILQWKFNDGKCILTQLEAKWYPLDNNQDGGGDSFTKRTMSKMGLGWLGSHRYFTEIVILMMMMTATLKTLVYIK